MLSLRHRRLTAELSKAGSKADSVDQYQISE